MGKKERLISLYQKIKFSPSNTIFDDLCRLAVGVGFVFVRQNSSHKIYKHPSYPRMMNFQNVKGKAKPYQIRQLLAFIDNNDLLKDEVSCE